MHVFSHQASACPLFAKIMLIGTLLTSVPLSCQAAGGEFVDLENPSSLMERKSVKPFTVSLVDSFEEEEKKKSGVVRIEGQEIKFVKLNDSLRQEATKSLRGILEVANLKTDHSTVLPLINYFRLLDTRNYAVETKIIPAVNDLIATLTQKAEVLELDNGALREENESLKQENERLKEEVGQLKNTQQPSAPSLSQPYPHPVGRWTPWGWLLTFFWGKTQPTITN